jgi:hypothetical protein
LPSLAGLAVVTGALLLTQYWSIFLAAATVGTIGWWGRRSGAAERAVAVRLVVAMAVGSLLFLPWIPSFAEQAAHTGTPWAPAPRPSVVVDLTLRDLGGGVIAEAGLLAALLVVLLVVGVFGRAVPEGVLVGARPVPGARGEAAVAALTLVIGAVAGLATASTYASRYAAVVLPLVVLVAARGITVLPGRRAGWLVAGAFVVFAAPGLVENVRTDRTQAGVLAADVAAGVGPGDAVVVCPDQLGPAMRRAMDHEDLDDVPLLAYPTLGDGRQVDWYDYEERNDATDPVAVASAVHERVPADAQVWVAWNGSYRTFDDDCEAFLNALAQQRGGFQLVTDDDSDFFEHAGLVVFR